MYLSIELKPAGLLLMKLEFFSCVFHFGRRLVVACSVLRRRWLWVAAGHGWMAGVPWFLSSLVNLNRLLASSCALVCAMTVDIMMVSWNVCGLSCAARREAMKLMKYLAANSTRGVHEAYDLNNDLLEKVFSLRNLLRSRQFNFDTAEDDQICWTCTARQVLEMIRDECSMWAKANARGRFLWPLIVANNVASN